MTTAAARTSVEARGYSMAGYYRMYFDARNGWNGTWLAHDAEFGKYGLHADEGKVLHDYCQWVIDTFTGGCDEKMLSFLSDHSEKKAENGLYYFDLDISEASHAVVEYKTAYGNRDYPIHVFLYRKDV